MIHLIKVLKIKTALNWENVTFIYEKRLNKKEFHIKTSVHLSESHLSILNLK